MPKTETARSKDAVAHIRVTRSGVQYVEPGYYLDDPDVRDEIRAMGRLFDDYVGQRERTGTVRGSGFKAKGAQRRRFRSNRVKRG